MSAQEGIRRRITVVTTSRADLGIYQPIISALRESQWIEPSLFVSGNHVPLGLPEAHRDRVTAQLCEVVGIPLSAAVPMPLGGGSAIEIAEAMGAVTAGSARALSVDRPDILLVLGDRYEMHAVAVAASALRIPVAHIHGGEESEGAIDNLYRHSMTKLSHLHFCATELSRKRILAMGEEPWRVHLSGAPALDGLSSLELDERAALQARLDLPDGPFFIATFHPETINVEGSLPSLEAMLQALDRVGVATVFSRANADEAGQLINERLEELAPQKSWLLIRDNLGRRGYFSAMRHAELMIGNSSSGIIEAASFGLPVVNIGSRQAGRERSANTIDVQARTDDILSAIARGRSVAFRRHAEAGGNVYVQGRASETIRAVLETTRLDRSLIVKRFHT